MENLRKDVETLKKNQREFLELKNIITCNKKFTKDSKQIQQFRKKDL